MTSIPKAEAVSTLRQQIESTLGADDLVETYNELFPATPAARTGSRAVDDLRREIVDYIDRGLETEEIVDLWNVVFPEHRRVAYDEDSDSIEYSLEPAYSESGEDGQ